MPKYLNAHALIAKTAKEMAQELFELWATDNEVYSQLRQRGEITEKHARMKFVHRVAPMLFEDARQQLGKLLGLPDDQISEHMKQEIYEALQLDNPLRAARMVAPEQATLPAHLQ